MLRAQGTKHLGDGQRGIGSLSDQCGHDFADGLHGVEPREGTSGGDPNFMAAILQRAIEREHDIGVVEIAKQLGRLGAPIPDGMLQAFQAFGHQTHDAHQAVEPFRVLALKLLAHLLENGEQQPPVGGGVKFARLNDLLRVVDEVHREPAQLLAAIRSAEFEPVAEEAVDDEDADHGHGQERQQGADAPDEIQEDFGHEKLQRALLELACRSGIAD